MKNRVITSFEIEYGFLLAMQKRGRELGFRSWGAYVRHMLEFHAVTFEPDTLGLVRSGHGKWKGSESELLGTLVPKRAGFRPSRRTL